METTRRMFMSKYGAAGLGSAAALVALQAPRAEGPVEQVKTSGPLNLRSFGAKGNGKASDTVAVRAWLDELLSTGRSGFVPRGTYKMSAPLLLDLARVRNDGVKIYGEGMHQSILDFESVDTAPQVLIFGSGGSVEDLLYCMYLSISDLGIKTRCAGPGVQVGQDDFADAINMASFRNLFITNTSKDAAAISLKLNQVLATTFTSVNAVCLAPGTGTALSMNQVDFCTFNSCSFGGANTCVHITNGSTYGNVFNAANLEMASYCVAQDSAAARNNVFVGGGFSGWTANALQSSAGGLPIHQLQRLCGCRTDQEG